MIKKLLHLIRWEEWYDSKLPLLAATAYYLAMHYPLPWPDAVARYSVSIIFCALFLAYGYAVNDYSDLEIDKLAGKRKLIAETPRINALVFLIALVLLGIVVLLPYYRDRKVILTVVLCYMLGTAYSLPPIRLKERGMAGLLGSAIAQRSLPALVIGAVWDSVDIVTLGWAFLGFLVGTRYILIHQYQDLSADIKSGVHTFATKNPGVIAQSIRWILMAEIVTAVLLAFSIVLSRIGFLMIPAGYVLYSVWYYSLYKRFIGVPGLTSFTHVPLADLYTIFLPVGLLLFLYIDDIRWLPFVPLEILWKRQCATQYFSLPYRYVIGLWQARAAHRERRK